MSSKREFEKQITQGSATPGESCEERNMRMGWGCSCHGMTFCPDLQFSHYEDDVPVFKEKRK